MHAVVVGMDHIEVLRSADRSEDHNAAAAAVGIQHWDRNKVVRCSSCWDLRHSPFVESCSKGHVV